MKKLSHVFLMFTFMACLFAYGCAKKADSAKPIDQVQAEVQKMSVSDLQSSAKAYADAIMSKRSDLEKIEQQLKSINPTEIFSEKAKGIKDQLQTISSEVSALTERYNIYAQKFQSMGGDVSKIKI